MTSRKPSSTKRESRSDRSNIYIAALQYGEERISKGVSYNDMIKHLEETGYYKKGDNISQFKEWFYLTFYNHAWAQTVYLIKTGKTKSELEMASNDYDSLTAFLQADQMFSLYDYLELKEARVFSRQAYKIAVIAIIISGFLASFSIVVQVFNISFVS